MCSYLLVPEKLEYKFKNVVVLNIGKELFRLRNLYKINLMYVAQKIFTV
ncbi:hypothetical protein ICM_02002 [Bacillus cereus BAG1X2-3]|nr:hypothetical protein ICC_02812 [Bacillus cereus BAG1X1-1]EOO48977.1 hypothetical protein ICI_02565 [Bacillus cereus BAG1X2-1]EOO52401.1 hypothetical protein ICK_02786 [Bacillus cereus BAG1X2-2]EOO59673.1 hypothetical protein ICM_02002 [Bacillus cereus BAG1X2-3]EOP05953.1 hypothetical protein ICO_02565 [Bacillus cereus BAG2O-1]